MSDFNWYEDLFLPFKRESKQNRMKLLITFIEKHGVNTIDRCGLGLFHFFGLLDVAKKHIDLIFEYKPIVPLFEGLYFFNWPDLYVGHFYVLHKVLEQDVEYRHIRRPFKLGMDCYSSFVEFYYENQNEEDGKCEYVVIFRNHFLKGITMFELMKYRYLN